MWLGCSYCPAAFADMFKFFAILRSVAEVASDLFNDDSLGDEVPTHRLLLFYRRFSSRFLNQETFPRHGTRFGPAGRHSRPSNWCRQRAPPIQVAISPDPNRIQRGGWIGMFWYIWYVSPILCRQKYYHQHQLQQASPIQVAISSDTNCW